MKKLILKQFLFTIFFIFSFFYVKCIAQNQTWDNFRLRLSTFSNLVNTVQADFVQEKKLKIMASQSVSRGKFWFEQPDRIRWEYQSPFSMVIVADKKVVIKDEKGIKEFNREKQGAIHEIMTLITDCFQCRLTPNHPKYHTSLQETASAYELQLSPRAIKKNMKIYITFDKKNMNVIRFKIQENPEEYTSITFQNEKRNLVFSSLIFKLK